MQFEVAIPEGLLCAALCPTYTSQHYAHLASTQFYWSTGSKFLLKSNVSLVGRRLDSLDMVGSKNRYNSYFAKAPGQSDTPRTASTDKSKGKPKSVSPSSSTVSASVDPNGSSKSSSIKSRSQPGVSPSPKKRQSSTSTPRSPRHSQVDVRKGLPELDRDSSYGSMDSPGSDSSDATPEPQALAQTLLSRKKKELVDRIMLDAFHPLFKQWLTTYFGAMRQAAHEADDSGGSGNSQAGGKGSRKSTRGQKRQYQKDDDQGDDAEDNDEGEDGDRSGNGNKRAKRALGPKFACPYFKHNPTKYKNHRTCCGPGWVDVHRVKEHLYRKHMLPEFICNRCYVAFKDDKEFKTHQRLPTPCPLKPLQQHDGFDKAKEKQLRSRTNFTSERQKWDEMYKILFPDYGVLPSPYYDEGPPSDPKSKDRNEKFRFVAEYEQYLSRSLPPLVRAELEREVEQEFNIVEDRLKTRMVEIFREVQIQLLRTFKAVTTPAVTTVDREGAPAPLDKKRASASPARLASPEPPSLPELQIGDLSGGLEPDFSDMMNEWELEKWLRFQEGAVMFEGQPSESDSGYGTVSNAAFSFAGTDATF